MAGNNSIPDGNSVPQVQEPRFANPVVRRLLPGLLIAAIGIAGLWAAVSFLHDVGRVSTNYRSLVRPPIVSMPPQPLVAPPQIYVPPAPHIPNFQPTVPVTLPRR